MQPIRPLLHALTLIALATVLSNCAGARFDRDWQAALAARSAAPAAKASADPISGPWQGTWLSHVNAHTGDLRCLVEPRPGTTPGQPGAYTFRYHATWGKIFQGGFDADFPVVRQGRRAYGVKGTRSLGLFGDFDHDGQIVGETFEATYASEMGDHGVFEMKRP